MRLRILVIDDQIARSEEEQAIFLRSIGDLSGYAIERRRLDKFDVLFCSGQRRSDNRIINDTEVAVEAVGSDREWALVLLDMQFDSGETNDAGSVTGQSGDALFGLEIERALLTQYPDLPIVRFAGKSELEINQSGSPYLAKLNLTPAEFRFALLTYGRLEVPEKKYLLDLDPTIIIASPIMFDIYCRAMKLATTEAPVLILGETGTGKEVLAKYIHHHSGRTALPFIPVNVAAIPEHLVDSELFGHERGAFTGADRQKTGHFEQAGGGTIFLDEIGDMPEEHQVRLLRVLQERQFRRVGASGFIPFNGRVILATHQDLSKRIKKGLFREDLYNRLTIKLTIPPLRERREEIIPLADRFLAETTAELGKEGLSFDDTAYQRLLQYDFPGNIRQLSSLTKEVVIDTGNNRLIRATDLHLPDQSSENKDLPGKVAGLNRDSALNKTEPPVKLNLSVSEIEQILLDFMVTPNDSTLIGIKPRMEKAVRKMLLKCAIACLERCRHPVTKKFRLLPAMQLLTGNNELKGTGAKRVINELIGRSQKINITQQYLEELCNCDALDANRSL